MRKVHIGALSGLIVAVALSGCAGGDGLLTTASTTPQAASVDPRCVTLLSQIEALRADGTVDRVEKAAEGSTRSVMVKREALSRVAQLNKANEEYRSNCSKEALSKPAQPNAAESAGTTTGAAAQPQASATQAAPAAAQSAAAPGEQTTSVAEVLSSALSAGN